MKLSLCRLIIWILFCPSDFTILHYECFLRTFGYQVSSSIFSQVKKTEVAIANCYYSRFAATGIVPRNSICDLRSRCVTTWNKKKESTSRIAISTMILLANTISSFTRDDDSLNFVLVVGSRMSIPPWSSTGFMMDWLLSRLLTYEWKRCSRGCMPKCIGGENKIRWITEVFSLFVLLYYSVNTIEIIFSQISKSTIIKNRIRW